ncbi:MAG: hypothetical protein Q4G61_08120 [Tissierellia bacterium]|nr:hypothetical protein [Tissierellia bacterium]
MRALMEKDLRNSWKGLALIAALSIFSYLQFTLSILPTYPHNSLWVYLPFYNLSFFLLYLQIRTKIILELKEVMYKIWIRSLPLSIQQVALSKYLLSMLILMAFTGILFVFYASNMLSRGLEIQFSAALAPLGVFIGMSGIEHYLTFTSEKRWDYVLILIIAAAAGFYGLMAYIGVEAYHEILANLGITTSWGILIAGLLLHWGSYGLTLLALKNQEK